jgi:isocitrate dehydrogenase
MSESEDREVRSYERLAERTRKILDTGWERSGEWLEQAMQKASTQLEEAGEISKTEASKAREALRRDLASLSVAARDRAETVRKGLHPSRVAGGFLDLASHLLATAGGAMSGWAERAEEALTYRTGQVTGPGTLTCTACGAELHPQKTTRIPPCPKCHKTEFRKSY